MNNTDLKAVVEGAKNLLITKGWIKRGNARDSDGDPVSALSEHAACFCAQGAIMRAAWDLGFVPQRSSQSFEEFIHTEVLYPVNKAIDRRTSLNMPVELWHINDDSKTIEPVIDVLDHVIKVLEAA